MWPYDEYREVCFVLRNTSEISLEEKHRVYLGRARSKEALHFNQSNSDNEKRAIAAALTYHIELAKEIIKGYPKGHNAVIAQSKRILIMEKARKRILGAIKEKNSN